MKIFVLTNQVMKIFVLTNIDQTGNEDICVD